MQMQVLEEAEKEKLLSDCTPDKAFWNVKGGIVRSIYELVLSLENIDEWTFRYHVNLDNNKNDFADWIREVIGDDTLAAQLEGVMNKKKYIGIIKKRLIQIEDMKVNTISQ